MLKTRKIKRTILPRTRQITEEEREAFKQVCNDGSIYYKTKNAGIFYCLQCNAVARINEHGAICCKNCGNTRIREAELNGYEKRVRSCEQIDGFVIIKDSIIVCKETTQGLKTFSYDDACIVIQGREVAFFDNILSVDIFDEESEREWERIQKIPSNSYCKNSVEPDVRFYHDGIYENPVFQIISDDIHSLALPEIYLKLVHRVNIVKPTEIVCPKFDDSIVAYDPKEALKTHTMELKEEDVGNNEVTRLHIWCSKCGKYSQNLKLTKYSYLSEICRNCNEKASSLNDRQEQLNYFIFPQEYEDGTILLRVDEVSYKARFLKENIPEVDPVVTFDSEISRTFYVYVLLTGKVVLFNESGECIDGTGIQNPSDWFLQYRRYIVSEEHKKLIINNKAIKRTGFIEYCEAIGEFNIKYFDAFLNIPSLEIFLRMGMINLVSESIYIEKNALPSYLRNGRVNDKIRKLTKSQTQNLTSSNCGLREFIDYMQAVKKDPEAMYEDFEWIISRTDHCHLMNILRMKVPEMTVKKIREYLGRVDEVQCCPVEESAQLWSGYLRMLKELDCDMTDTKLIYPSSLKREDDKATRKITQINDEELNKRFHELTVDNEKYTWENNEFKVLVPHDIYELYEEVRKLYHDVGAYGRAIAAGGKTIVFIREISEPDKPFCIVEIRKETIVKANGYLNMPISCIPRAMNFIHEWAKNKGLKCTM